MSYYGGTQITTLSKDVFGCILNLLSEEFWYKLKWNRKILDLMYNLHKQDKIKNLARNGHVESLVGHSVSLKYICEYGSVNLVDRINHYSDVNEGLRGACRVEVWILWIL